VSITKPVHEPLVGAPPVQRRRWRLIACGTVATAVVLAGGSWFYHAAGTRTRADRTGHSPQLGPDTGLAELVPVETVRLSPGGIVRTSSQIGSVHAFQEADLFAKVSGYLKELYVDFGSRVKEGQLLAEIDDPEVFKDEARAAAAVDQAKAAVKQAKARIETAAANLKTAEATIGLSKAELERRESSREYREKQYRRIKDLVARKVMEPKVEDEEKDRFGAAVADVHAAEAAVKTAEAEAAAAKAKLDTARADLAEAEANVEVDQANLAKAHVLVEYTRITSPYNGVITGSYFFRGAFIRSAAEGETRPLLSVARTDKVRVVTAVPDRDVPLCDVGDDAEITIDALPSRVFKAKVSRFADVEDPTSRTMHTEIDLPNPEDRLRPGMYGIARIFLETSTKRSTLPASCLVGDTSGERADVYVVKDGRAKKTPIQVGAEDGLRVEVTAGLDPNDEVVVSPSTVTEMALVRPVSRMDRAGQ
jgi:RND family efflux transporter MFP subunit